MPYPNSKDITLSWCSKHGEWYVQNCPDCVGDDMKTDYEAQIKAIKTDYESLEGELLDLKERANK